MYAGMRMFSEASVFVFDAMYETRTPVLHHEKEMNVFHIWLHGQTEEQLFLFTIVGLIIQNVI